MANYECKARTNYFKVKHDAKFVKWAKQFQCEIVRDSKDPELVALLLDEGIPSGCENEKTGEYDEVDFTNELSKHLKKDHVAVIMESGYEKMRYVSGQAIAVNHKGKTIFLCLHDIYEQAKHLGRNITACEY